MEQHRSIYFWKWSLGEGYYKSARPETKQKQNLSNDEQIFTNNDHNAVQQSLYTDSDMIDITNSIFSRNTDIRSASKREDLDTKIADREMIAQRGINPFLSNSSYVSDINTCDSFLKPQNTSLSEVKY
jgi:hypothetical protein